MRVLALFTVIGSLILAGTSALAQDHPCQAAVEHALAGHGIKPGEVKVLGWKTDHFAEEGGGDGPIDGYRFYGRPSSCESGEISIELGKHCGVEDVFTHGGCRIKGISHIWW